MRELGVRFVISVAILIVILSFAAYEIVNTPGSVALANPPTRFTVNGHSFNLTYIATDQHSREVGLMDRKITNATTMLFVFSSPGTYTFWMSGVNSSLDIIWLSTKGDIGRVVYFVRNASVCSVSCPDYTPSTPANWVLEARGGFSDSNGITLGSEIQFS
jgi:uncharacterized membrane protein (UPF0127 family)